MTPHVAGLRVGFEAAGKPSGGSKKAVKNNSLQYPLVGYHGEPKVNLLYNLRIISGLYYPKRLQVVYSTARSRIPV